MKKEFTSKIEFSSIKLLKLRVYNHSVRLLILFNKKPAIQDCEFVNVP